MVKKVTEITMTIKQYNYDITTGVNVDFSKCKTTVEEAQNQIYAFYYHDT